MIPEPILTSASPAPGGYYSQAVRAGGFLFISGQLPLDLQGKLKGQTIAEQTAVCLANVEAILRAAGGELRHLVQVTVYVSDITHWPEVDRVYRDRLEGVPFPPRPGGSAGEGAALRRPDRDPGGGGADRSDMSRRLPS